MPNLLPLMFIALGALALVATLFFLWQSIREAMTPPSSIGLGREVVSRERAALLSEKHSLLIALRDLEAEREAGKLSQDDFTELSGRYRTRARDVLRALDTQLSPHRGAAKDLIERARAGVPDVRDEAVATADAAVSGSSTSRTCSCGTNNDIDAVFCKKCGARLIAEQDA